jgi:putative endonuclease
MDTRGRNTPANIGRAAEDRALVFLEKAGLCLLERNFRCRAGEIDLIMREGGTIVFVEVRLRRVSRFGTAAESVGSAKLRRVQFAAELWLRLRGRDSPARIDVLTLDGAECETARIGWIRGASV